MSSNYCPRIHHGLTLSGIRDQKLTYAVCCWANKTITTDNRIQWYHQDINTLRQQNQQGILPESHCSSCIKMEDTGTQSMRQGYEIMHGTPTYDNTLQYLDVNIDYTCNLACVTCGPEFSTTWRNELQIKDLSPRPDIDSFLDRFEEFDLSNLKEIRLWGGEPFLTLTHQKILEYVSNRVDPSNIKLMYNTNGTRRIDNQTKELIERYKFARISFSVDAIGPKFDYIRYPAKWIEVEENLLWWQQNLPHNSMLSMTVTASLLNVLTLNDVYQWHRQHWQESRYGDPIEIFVHGAFGTFGLENMPTDMAQHFRAMKDYCQPWLQSMENLASNPQGPAIALNYLQSTDQRRNLNFAEVLPELAKWLHS